MFCFLSIFLLKYACYVKPFSTNIFILFSLYRLSHGLCKCFSVIQNENDSKKTLFHGIDKKKTGAVIMKQTNRELI